MLKQLGPFISKVLNPLVSRGNAQSPLENKASYQTRVTGYKTLGSPVWTHESYTPLTQEGYERNPLVYRCVRMISSTLASVPLVIKQADTQEILDQHPLLSLLQQPNALYSGHTLFESLLSHLLLSGNAYVQGVQNDRKEFQDLYVLRPDRVKIIPGFCGEPEAYEYSVDGQTQRLMADGHDNGDGSMSKILHVKLFNPLNDWYGLSPLQAARKSVDIYNAISGYNLAFIQNGARPSGALMVKAQYELSDEERTRLRDELRMVYEGPHNAGRVAMLEGDFSFQEMGKSPKDCEFIEGKLLVAREIAQIFGVPPILLGLPGSSAFSNYREARYHFWQETLLPLLDRVLEELGQWLALQTETSGNWTLTYDKDAISGLSYHQESVWERISQASFLTVNEKREALGYPPLDDGGADQLSDGVM